MDEENRRVVDVVQGIIDRYTDKLEEKGTAIRLLSQENESLRQDIEKLQAKKESSGPAKKSKEKTEPKEKVQEKSTTLMPQG